MKARRLFRREFGHGARIPRGWRLAWYEPRRRVGVYFPWPLHWLRRTGREIFHRVRRSLRSPAVECLEIMEMQRAHRERLRLADEYARGYLAGWRECLRACLAAAEEEFARSDEAWEIGALLAESFPEKENN